VLPERRETRELVRAQDALLEREPCRRSSSPGGKSDDAKRRCLPDDSVLGHRAV
jgi:hypothetical protein